MDKIIVLDTTLRDGDQTPGINLNLSEKLDIAHQLEGLGIDVVEAGFPAASEGDFEAVRAISQSLQSTAVAALCRCVPRDIEVGWQAVRYSVKPRLHLFIATSEIHMKYKLHMDAEKVFCNAVDSVRLASSLCGDVEFSCEDASRSEPSYLSQLLEAVIDAGATTINLPDTVGYALPDEYAGLINGVLAKVPNIHKAVISVHCHNDLGLAVANTLAGVSAGARQIETTINGLGERAGNCTLDEVIMCLETRNHHLGIGHNIDASKIYRVSQRVSKLSGLPIPVNKAIVGRNAFTHESGVHQHGVLQNPLTYEIMTPQSIGRNDSTLSLGKLSGRHAFAERLQQMGYSLNKMDIDHAFDEFKKLADRKANITEADLEALATMHFMEVDDYFKLHSYQIQSGKGITSLACITLEHEEGYSTEAAIGEGPVDAACNAVMRIVGGSWPLATYEIKAVTGGLDALGEVIVRVEHEGASHTGRGLSTDVIESSILAYINAINRAYAYKAKQAGAAQGG